MDLIRMAQGSQTLVLHGAGLSAPFKGALLSKVEQRANEAVTSQVDILLEGTSAQIETTLAELGRMLDDAQRWAGIPGWAWVYLEVCAAAGGQVWRSKVHSGQLELLGAGVDQRAGGSQGLRLHLVRSDWWEGPQEDVFTSAAGEGRSQYGKAITNAPGSNYLHVDGSDIAGDLPAPCILRAGAFGLGASGGDLLVSENVFSTPASLGVYYQGEAGTVWAGSMAADYALLSWSGAAETVLWSYDLGGADLRMMGGRAVRVMARLRSPVTGGAVWHRWELQYYYNSGWNTIWTSEGAYLGGVGVGGQLALGPVISMPPWYVDADTAWAETLRLRLVAQGDLSGAHALELDYLGLLPLDGWRFYARLLPQNDLRLVDDPLRGVIYPGGDGIMQSHTAEGPGLLLYPGRSARFFFHTSGSGTGGYTTGQVSVVSLAYRARKRTL